MQGIWINNRLVYACTLTSIRIDVVCMHVRNAVHTNCMCSSLALYADVYDIRSTKGMYTTEGFTASFPNTDADAAQTPAHSEKITPVC